MKKFLAGLVMGAILATGVSTWAAGQQVKLVVDGQEVVSDVPAQVIDGRTLVPARALAEALKATVLWDAATSTVVVTSPPDQTSLTPPGTVDVAGVTYYYIPTLMKLLSDKFAPDRVGMGEGIHIDGNEYESQIHGIENTRFFYREVRALLDANVITQADLDKYYGK